MMIGRRVFVSILLLLTSTTVISSWLQAQQLFLPDQLLVQFETRNAATAGARSQH